MTPSNAHLDFAACSINPRRSDGASTPDASIAGYTARTGWLKSRDEGEPTTLNSALNSDLVGLSAPRHEAPLIYRLGTIDGFDVDLALRYVGGQLPVLVRVLRRFVATYRAGMPTLLDTNGDEHELVLRWRASCHSMRGTLAMIGTPKLMRQVRDLETALRDLSSRARLVTMGRSFHESLLTFVEQLADELED